jgi:hypothetical protein
VLVGSRVVVVVGSSVVVGSRVVGSSVTSPVVGMLVASGSLVEDESDAEDDVEESAEELDEDGEVAFANGSVRPHAAKISSAAAQ